MTMPNHPTPAEPTPTMAEAIAHIEAELREIKRLAVSHLCAESRAEYARDAATLDLALAAMRAVSGEPVDWQWRWCGGARNPEVADEPWYTCNDMQDIEWARSNPDTVETRPLYAFPSRGQQAGGA